MGSNVENSKTESEYINSVIDFKVIILSESFRHGLMNKSL